MDDLEKDADEQEEPEDAVEGLQKARVKMILLRAKSRKLRYKPEGEGSEGHGPDSKPEA